MSIFLKNICRITDNLALTDRQASAARTTGTKKNMSGTGTVTASALSILCSHHVPSEVDRDTLIFADRSYAGCERSGGDDKHGSRIAIACMNMIGDTVSIKPLDVRRGPVPRPRLSAQPRY